MGALSGHIMSLHEDLDLTFGELISIVEDLSLGRLSITEKFDGYAIHARWDETVSDLRVARSQSDVKNGGVDESVLIERYRDYPELSASLVEAMSILRKVFESGSPRLKSSMCWLPFEIVTNPGNCLNYDGKYIIAHKGPILNPIGQPTKNYSFVIPVGLFNEWSVHQPIKMKLKPLTEGNATQQCKENIKTIMSGYGLTERSTLKEYMTISARNYFTEKTNNNAPLAAALTSRLTTGKPDLRSIKKKWFQLEGTIDSLKRKDVIKELMQPIEAAIFGYGCERLRGVKSKFIKDAYYESVRLSTALKDARQSLQESEKELNEYDKHIKKFNFENYDCAIEGIVFEKNNKTYKLTGNFGPTNRILGMIKYRKKNPLSEI